MLKPTRVVNYLTMRGIAQEIYIRRMSALPVSVTKGLDMEKEAELQAAFALSAAEAFTDASNKRYALELSDV